MHTNNFLFQISGGTFHVVLDFPCALFIAKHCYFPNSEQRNPKVRSEKMILSFRKEIFSNLVFTFIAEKWIAKKKSTIFFPYTKIAKQKNSQLAKFRIKNTLFRKHQLQKKFAKILWKKSSQQYFCEKKIFRQKTIDKKNFHQKKICRKKFS